MNSFLVLLLAIPAALAQLQNVTIHAGADGGWKCLDVRADILADGTPVQIYDCNGTPAQTWTVSADPGPTKLQLAGTNFCLDAGSTPGNGVAMKIWTCYAGLAAQQWYLTDDGRVALENQGLCLDLTNGDPTNENLVQTWQCTANDFNQFWAPMVVTSNVVQLHPNGNPLKCVDIRDGDFSLDTPVQIYDCNGTPAQDFVLVPETAGIRVNGTNLCLDSGSPTSNGYGVTIWTCYADLASQQWDYIGNGSIILAHTNFCLDLTNGDITDGNQLQVWTCTEGDFYQRWTATD